MFTHMCTYHTCPGKYIKKTIAFTVLQYQFFYPIKQFIFAASISSITDAIHVNILFSHIFLLSAGFSASSGINHVLPFFTTPDILPCSHNNAILLADMPHFSDISNVVKYSISRLLNSIYYYIHLSE